LQEEKWQTRKIISPSDPAFQALLDIYTEAHPASERKSTEALHRMIARPSYLFLVTSERGSVVGLTISACLAGCDACLLEYMAVKAECRGRGIGARMFSELAARPELSGRFLMLEVDSDKPPEPDVQERTRRKNFYRRLGCKEVRGFAYKMPAVSAPAPPPMEIMLYRKPLPESIEVAVFRSWIECCYEQIYGVSGSSADIDLMFHKLDGSLQVA